MPTVHVTSESDIPQGWRYVIDIDHDDGSHSTHRLRLAWVDHNHWAGERSIPPSRVAQVLIECLLAVGLDEPLPARFDAATARRWVPAIDEELAGKL